MNAEITPEQREALRAAASIMGRIGGRKGGRMRAINLDAFRRFEIASMGGREASRRRIERMKVGGMVG